MYSFFKFTFTLFILLVLIPLFPIPSHFSLLSPYASSFGQNLTFRIDLLFHQYQLIICKRALASALFSPEKAWKFNVITAGLVL